MHTSWKTQGRGGSRGGRTRRAPPLKLEKNMICLRKIVIFHRKYPKTFRAIILSAPPPLTSIPGSAPARGRRGHDLMVVGFISTCVISAYNH